MWRQTHYEASNKVRGFFDVVVGRKLVYFPKQFVKKVGNMNKIVCTFLGNNYVLNLEFANLLRFC